MVAREAGDALVVGNDTGIPFGVAVGVPDGVFVAVFVGVAVAVAVAVGVFVGVAVGVPVPPPLTVRLPFVVDDIGTPSLNTKPGWKLLPGSV